MSAPTCLLSLFSDLVFSQKLMWPNIQTNSTVTSTLFSFLSFLNYNKLHRRLWIWNCTDAILLNIWKLLKAYQANKIN